VEFVNRPEKSADFRILRSRFGRNRVFSDWKPSCQSQKGSAEFADKEFFSAGTLQVWGMAT
jgi:hypothetical protein